MNRTVKNISVVCSILAFVVCLAAGGWIITNTGFKKEDAVWTGIGLYFIGKAFFVGPMLLMTALKYE